MANNQICGTWNNRLETVKITVIEYASGDIFTVFTKPAMDRREMEKNEVEDLIKQLKLEGFEKE